MIAVVSGSLVLALSARTPSVLVVAIACFLVGLGLGLVATPSLIAAQASVAWNERGVVTGTNLFARSIGSAVGVAIFGAIANGIIGRDGAGPVAGVAPAAIIDASTAVFVATLIAALATAVLAASMPRTPVPRPDAEEAASPARA